MQRETRGGKFALHSQSIQMVCHQFLANVETIKQLRQNNPRHRYPYHPKKYMTVEWPAQAVSRQGKRLILPMGRGRKSLSLHLGELPEQIGAVSLVWNGGYELHLVVAPPSVASPLVSCDASPDKLLRATADLGEIHQVALTTTSGKGLIVTGRGIRSLKRQHNQTLGQLARLQARCQKGSKRWRRLQYTQARASGQHTRRVRTQNKGRHHNQRMAQWEYGKDKDYLQQKCAQVGIVCFSGSERGTSSHCPRCDWRKKPKGRNWICRRCGFVGHRDIVGSMN